MKDVLLVAALQAGESSLFLPDPSLGPWYPTSIMNFHMSSMLVKIFFTSYVSSVCGTGDEQAKEPIDMKQETDNWYDLHLDYFVYKPMYPTVYILINGEIRMLSKMAYYCNLYRLLYLIRSLLNICLSTLLKVQNLFKQTHNFCT